MTAKVNQTEEKDYGLEGSVYNKIDGVRGMQMELKYNPNTQNIKTIINEIFDRKLNFESEAEVKSFVKQAVIEYGLQCSKNLSNELLNLSNEIKASTKFFHDFDEGYNGAVAKAMYKYYLAEYKKTGEFLKKLDEADNRRAEQEKKKPKGKKASIETKKSSKPTRERIDQIKMMVETKSEKMRILYKEGLEPKEIREVFDCKYAQVRNAIKSLLN